MSRLGRAQPFAPLVSARPKVAAGALAGFSFDSAAGCIFGEISGAMVSLARCTATDVLVYVYDDTPAGQVAASGTLTTDSNGRLPRWTHPSLVSGSYYSLLFKRVSDGALTSKRMQAS